MKKIKKSRILGFLPVCLEVLSDSGDWLKLKEFELSVMCIQESNIKSTFNLPSWRNFCFLPSKKNIHCGYMFMEAISFPTDQKTRSVSECIVSVIDEKENNYSLPLALNRVSNKRLIVFPEKYRECKKKPEIEEQDVYLITTEGFDFSFRNELYSREGKAPLSFSYKFKLPENPILFPIDFE